MNDAMASGQPENLAGASLAEISATLSASAASPVNTDALTAYSEFCKTAHFAPVQSPAWINHWVNQVAPDAVIATLFHNSMPVLSLALEVVRSGPFSIARFMGGGYANGNFPACDPHWTDIAAMPTTLRPLFKSVSKARPDIDLISLERLQPDINGASNPLLVIPGQPSPATSLAVDLKDGLEAILTRIASRSKRNGYPARSRKFEALDGYRQLCATSPDQVQIFLDALFAMQEAGFRIKGSTDAFASADIRRFFTALFIGALDEAEPPFILQALEVQGQIQAVTGLSCFAKRLTCEFGSILEDEAFPLESGDFLFFENIREACKKEFNTYSFSVANEPIRREWYDTEIQQTDVLVPLTARGQVLAFARRRTARLKPLIKKSQAIRDVVARLRKKRRSPPQRQLITPITQFISTISCRGTGRYAQTTPLVSFLFLPGINPNRWITSPINDACCNCDGGQSKALIQSCNPSPPCLELSLPPRCWRVVPVIAPRRQLSMPFWLNPIG